MHSTIFQKKCKCILAFSLSRDLLANSYAHNKMSFPQSRCFSIGTNLIIRNIIRNGWRIFSMLVFPSVYKIS